MYANDEQNVNNGVTKDSPVLILYIHLEAGAAAVSDKYTEGKVKGGGALSGDKVLTSSFEM